MPVTREHLTHLLGLDGLKADELNHLLDRARWWRDAGGHALSTPPLVERTLACIFEENSTRTLISFTLAARRVGAEIVALGDSSSRAKGETLLDTCMTLRAMGVAGFIIRARASGAPHQIAATIERPVINAGDGRHEHPTQGLADLLTLQDHLGDLAGRTIAIVGDIANSRVARSAIFGLTALGADVVLVGPPRLAPDLLTRISNGRGEISIERDLDDAVERVDSIMMLRVQFERDAGDAIASIDEYRTRYCLTRERARRLPDHARVLHPGPMNRGIEIESIVADDPDRSVVLEQVGNGVAVRTAVLEATCVDPPGPSQP